MVLVSRLRCLELIHLKMKDNLQVVQTLSKNSELQDGSFLVAKRFVEEDGLKIDQRGQGLAWSWNKTQSKQLCFPSIQIGNVLSRQLSQDNFVWKKREIRFPYIWLVFAKHTDRFLRFCQLYFVSNLFVYSSLISLANFFLLSSIFFLTLWNSAGIFNTSIRIAT